MTGRPKAEEAAEYYFRYINLVRGDDARAEIESQFDPAVEFFATISEEKSLCRYAPGKWSMRDTLNHISDIERVLSYRAMWFARGLAGPLPNHDQVVAAEGAKADLVAWAGHIEEFRRVRLATISLFRHLPDDAWMRTGVASGNRFTVRALAFVVAGHLTHHLKILREKYL